MDDLTNVDPFLRSLVAEKPILRNSFAYTSPYTAFHLFRLVRSYKVNLFGKKVVRERDLVRLLMASEFLPELMIMGNFIVDRASIVALCRTHGINTLHTEDGFLPHYSTFHADPLGFAWESSLPRLSFFGIADSQRKTARSFRKSYLEVASREGEGVPLNIVGLRKPYVLFPLQLIGDKVNTWDLNLSSWVEAIEHARRCVPADFQLVVKPHPRGRARDSRGVVDLAERLKNVVFLDHAAPKHALQAECSAVVGVNSTILYESRLIYLKPTYVYGKSWFTNHTELFLPLHLRCGPRTIPLAERLYEEMPRWSERLEDYADWFLYQLLLRQYNIKAAETEGERLDEWLYRRSYSAYKCYGDDLFL